MNSFSIKSKPIFPSLAITNIELVLDKAVKIFVACGVASGTIIDEEQIYFDEVARLARNTGDAKILKG
jgi:hypothetical protein